MRASVASRGHGSSDHRRRGSEEGSMTLTVVTAGLTGRSDVEVRKMEHR